MRDLNTLKNRDAIESLAPILPATMTAIAKFLTDPERAASIPASSTSRVRVTLWPERRRNDLGQPWHTLLDLGGVEEAFWRGGSSFSQQGLREGISVRSRPRADESTFDDDFALVIDRGPDETGFSLYVEYGVDLDDHPGQACKLRISIRDLDDADVATLLEDALERRYRGQPARDALLATRDTAIDMGAQRFGQSWVMPARPKLDLEAHTFGEEDTPAIPVR